MKIVEVDKSIRELVVANDGYCPCTVVKNEDTKCMCKEFKEQTSGLCHCGRFEKVEELTIHVMHGYDTVQAPTGEDCFGCYISGKHEIYVADNIPADQFFYTIAHEYMHYLQDIEGREFNEKEADDFAQSVFTLKE